MEKLDIWHSSDVEVRKKINELIGEIEKIKLELGIIVDTEENI